MAMHRVRHSHSRQPRAYSRSLAHELSLSQHPLRLPIPPAPPPESRPPADGRGPDLASTLQRPRPSPIPAPPGL